MGGEKRVLPPKPKKLPEGAPRSIGVALFPQFELLDVMGPLEAWTTLAHGLSDPEELKLSILSTDREPVSSGPPKQPEGKPAKPGNAFRCSVVPTHTYAAPPEDLEVLLIPGGLGSGIPGLTAPPPDSITQPPEIDAIVEFLRQNFSKLKYVITVCTGAGIIAQAGLLDGLKATTNKAVWTTVVSLGPRTYWVAKARWVKSSEKIWTTSGVSAGTDGVLAWMEEVYGKDAAEATAISMEYIREPESSGDPFAEDYDCQDVPPTENT